MFILVLIIGLSVAPAVERPGKDAYGGHSTDDRCTATGAFGSGVLAAERGLWDIAERYLAETFAHAPACFLPDYGSVAYWLGNVYSARGRADAAKRVWRRGVDALASTERRDLRLLDRYILTEIAGGERRGVDGAAVRFNDLVLAACEPVRQWERPIVARRVAQLALMIDAEDSRRLVAGSRSAGRQVVADVADCQYLVDWFEARNPLPAEPANQRLVQHLERVAVAERLFASSSDTGYDERGQIYVRYGAPHQNMQLRYDDLRFAREVFRFGLDVSRGDFPDHEIWGYNVDGSDYTFIFVRGRDGYRMGTSLDLLPQALRQGHNHEARGQNRATAALAAMRWIYERLAIHHSGYGVIYQEIDAYETQQETVRSLHGLVPGRDDRSDPGRRAYGLDYQVSGGAGGAGGAVAPAHFIQEVLAKTDNHERELTARRESRLPTSTGGIQGSDRLSLDGLRTARLLRGDGSTHLLVFWRDGVTVGDQLRVDRTYGLRHRARLLSIGSNPADRTVMVDSTYAVRAGQEPVIRIAALLDRRLTGGALQVDRLLVSGEWIGSGSRTVDSLEPLQFQAGAIEVSDLIPFEVQDIQFAQVQMREEPGIAGLQLYPDHQLGPQEALGAYFEIYVPGATARDRDIIITYEVVRKQAGRFLRGERVETTVLPFRRLTVGDRLPAAFLVDRSTWEGADEVELVVTVTDELTDREIVRTLHFSVD